MCKSLSSTRFCSFLFYRPDLVSCHVLLFIPFQSGIPMFPVTTVVLSSDGDSRQRVSDREYRSGTIRDDWDL